MGPTHGMGPRKSIMKTLRFVDFGAALAIRITFNSKPPATPLVIATKFATQTPSSPLVIHTKKKSGNSVMTISQSQGDFVVSRNKDHPPVRFYRMRNPPSLNLPEDLQP